MDGRAVVESHREAHGPIVAALRGYRSRRDHPSAVRFEFGPAHGEQITRRRPVATEEVVDAFGGCVARCAGIEHQHRPPRPCQGRRGAESGGPAADHCHVVCHAVYAPSLHAPACQDASSAPDRQVASPLAETATSGESGCHDGQLRPVLDAVGPRLRTLRGQRDMTLGAVERGHRHLREHAVAVGGGQRKPTLELLLPLAATFGVQLDELVGAPPTGDPRVHLKPVTRGGRTLRAADPSSRRRAGVQARDPAVASTPNRRCVPTPATSGSTCSTAGCG